jgi:choline dehydrogenase-like flavoprotein
VTPGEPGPVDVVIIGAGASGGVAAGRLVEAGYSVVCLEQGRWPDRASFPGASDEWELAGRQLWSGDPMVRRGPGDYPIDVTDSDVGVLNFNGVGGGTVLYAAQWPRLLPSDFTRRTIDGVADDWPLHYQELLPFYERTDAQFGVSGLGGDPAFPPGADPPFPPLPIGEAALRVARAHVRKGWHWWPAANAILSAPSGDRHPCVQRGTCLLGCNEGAKASTDITHWPQVARNGGRLVTGARVTGLPTDGRGRVTGAEWLDEGGKAHFQPADVVLLAANGIGTPRLLLASASSRSPDGLANSSGLVGRRLMVHPLALVKGLFDDDLESWRGHAGGSIVSYQFYASDERRGFVGSAKWAMSPAGGPLRAALAGGGEWGAEHHRHVRERLGRSAHWGIVCEDLPIETNRIELSTSMVDDLGLAAPKMTYRIDPNTDDLCNWHIDRASESLQEAGAWRTEVEVRYPPNGHFMGTAVMGDDPASSVVDRWSMCHDVPNLGIIDGSVFVTAGGVNPTSTISALALRAVEHLIEDRSGQAVPDRSRSYATGAPVDAGSSSIDPGRPILASTTNRPTPSAVDATVRSRLVEVADFVIPERDGMPSAGQVGVSGALLDRVLLTVPNLADLINRALDAEVGHPERWFEAMVADDPDGLRAVLLAITGAYYLDTGVKARIGYPGQIPFPVRAGHYPDYMVEDLLSPVLAVGHGPEGQQ